MKFKPTSTLNRVNRSVPCPVCGKQDWCMVSRFGDHAICCRHESERPAPAFSGWHHAIPPRSRLAPALIAQATRPISQHPIRDFGDLHRAHVARFGANQRAVAAEALGLDPCVFDFYSIGYSPALDAIAIPAMQVGSPDTIGIRYRRINHRKGGPKWSCEPQSTAGLLLPNFAPVDGEPICLLEGPSDTLAAAQIDLYAIGRWSCGLDSRQAETLKSHLASVSQPTIVVVGDNDAHRTGAKGADAAAELVSQTIPNAIVMRVQPPPSVKDVRDWVVTGAACASDVIDAGKEVRRGE